MSRRASLSFCVLLCGMLAPFFAYGAEVQTSVLTLEKNGEVLGTLSPNLPSLGSLALGDLGTDGTSEIVAATGYGTPTEVVVLRKDGSHIGSFAPYDAAFSGGASVALCDLDGDGYNEIVTGAGFGGGPHVRVFSNMGVATGVQFFAYDEAFRGGISLLCADVTADGKADIITVPGPTGGPHVKIFSSTGVLEHELFLSDFPSNSGLSLALLSQKSSPELVVTPASLSTSIIAYLGVQKSQLTLLREETRSDLTSPLALSTTNGSTLSVGTATVSGTEKKGDAFYRISGKPTTALAEDTSAKYIHVDLSTQTLTAYEYGVPAFSFLVSTGVPSHPTPLGKTSVMAKLPTHDYSWFYGEGNPANYSLPNVLWNLRFRNHYYIHSAYWHNNFGHVMSHGCINTSIPNGEKIFNWADVGTPVEVIE